MNAKEKFETYFSMFNEKEIIEKEIRTVLLSKGYTVYTVFLSVGNEETAEYFVDIEYGGSPEKYNRIRGLYTKEQLAKKFHI